MATQTIKLLNLPDGGSYNFNAVQLDGHAASYFATAARVEAIEAIAAKALHYEGTLAAGSYTPAADLGATYIVEAAGTVNGVK